jgi:hypothetical protein
MRSSNGKNDITIKTIKKDGAEFRGNFREKNPRILTHSFHPRPDPISL